MVLCSRLHSYVTGPFTGAVTLVIFPVLARSNEARRSFGAVDTEGPGVTSIASCEALDARAGGSVSRAKGLDSHGVLGVTDSAVSFPFLGSGEAALAAPTKGAGGETASSQLVILAAALGRGGAAP